MVSIKVLTAAAAIVTLGITAPVAAEGTTPATTIHEESPRAGTGVSVDSNSNTVKHDLGGADGENGGVPDADKAVHSSAYKKTYPEEPEVSELEE